MPWKKSSESGRGKSGRRHFLRAETAGLWLQEMCSKTGRNGTASLKSFHDMLQAISSSLAVGYSLENAFTETLTEMRALYGSKNKLVKELDCLVQKIRRRVPLDEAMEEFAAAIGLMDAHRLATVLTVGKQMGGNMEASLRQTADTISGKIEVQEEIKTMLTRLKLEMNLMRVLPILLLLYMSSTSDFLEPLFTTLAGRLVLAAGAVIYFTACYIAGRIVKIEV